MSFKRLDLPMRVSVAQTRLVMLESIVIDPVNPESLVSLILDSDIDLLIPGLSTNLLISQPVHSLTIIESFHSIVSLDSEPTVPRINDGESVTCWCSLRQ